MSYKKQERNIGINLLRIFLGMMVSTLHVLGHGGFLDKFELFSVKYEFC